ncbi:energy transducer TonB [Sphingosinicella soli]|uniref:Protein TonB n=1 Tax=Sphingosinicella soli TaxID=333708 RepID=A0A7W7F727_9SPHN|nr:energy transducer TonB [Sphingosinicella soli]MBB4633185.1 protein TonB [Sphingosinicella soli]
MHTVHARSADDGPEDALLSERLATAHSLLKPAMHLPNAERADGYTPMRADWRALLAVAVLHVALGVFLVQSQVVPPRTVQSAMKLLDLSAPPPAPEAPPPQIAEPEIYVPPPAVEIARPAPPILATADLPQMVLPPAPAAIKAPAAPRAPAPPTLVSDDLGATMISAKPPSYPLESRRKHEQGTVVLMLTLGTDGCVADIRLARSSGFERLDRAALGAVRHWRWSPTVREGVAVAVQGTVEIPFVLQG